MTTIGPETQINGRIEGDADVTVEGRVDGTISLTETLTVAPDGFVTGDVEAKMVVIEGYASGTLRASSVVHLTSSAQVEGEIFANAVRLDPGARLKGRIEMDVDAAPPLPKRPERSTPKRAPKPEAAPARTEPATESAPEPEPEPEPEPKPKPKAAPKRNDAPKFDPDELTVKELREMLTERGLPLSGTKTELVKRLRTGE